MLEIDIEVLDDGLPVDGYSQGYIAIRGDYGEVKTKGSVMIFITLSQLLYRVSLFIQEKKKKEELSIGIDSCFNPYLVLADGSFSFLDLSGDIISRSTKFELTSAVLNAVEKVYDRYASQISSDDSAMIDLRNALLRFRKSFPQAKAHLEK